MQEPVHVTVQMATVGLGYLEKLVYNAVEWVLIIILCQKSKGLFFFYVCIVSIVAIRNDVCTNMPTNMCRIPLITI